MSSRVAQTSLTPSRRAAAVRTVRRTSGAEPSVAMAAILRHVHQVQRVINTTAKIRRRANQPETDVERFLT